MKKKIIVIVTLGVLLTLSSFPVCSGSQINTNQQPESEIINNDFSQENVAVSCYSIGIEGKQIQKGTMSRQDAEILHKKILKMQREIVENPTSDTVKQLQQEIIMIAEEHDLLPNGPTTEKILKQITTQQHKQSPRFNSQSMSDGKASEFFCNFVTWGSGSTIPIIILPRLIPIIQMPIPRAFIRWSTSEGGTSAGGLRSGTGFIAAGEQKGIALGFWGIGFSIFLPPVRAYGLIGYALYTQVSAEEIEYWPPNNPPIITGTDPADGEINIPLSTSELRFQIEDPNGDLMSYSVTTIPDIGSGTGGLKSDGLYSIPISGLQGFTEYSWTISVDDGKDTVEKTMTFVTEQIAPIISNPQPEDDERYISLNLSQLRFHIKDLQGDLMDYTVETSPDIGSGSDTNVHDGTYAIAISGLNYSQRYVWYINVTDGSHWTREIYHFQAEHKMIFDPYNEGWHYRKQITIDHTKVSMNFTNFPMLMSAIDLDLSDKAQDFGDDILFMMNSDISTRLYHEIEQFDSTSGKIVVWINVPNLSAYEDTILFMYYGNPECQNQESPELVWDSQYMLVQHFDEIFGTLCDSTIHRNHGTPFGGLTQDAIGKIDGADQYDGLDDYVECQNSDSLNPPNAITIEAWYKPVSFSGSGMDPIIDKGYTTHQNPFYQYHLGVCGDQYPGEQNTHFTFLLTAGGIIEKIRTPNGYWTIGNWYHLVGTYDGLKMKFYVNNNLIGEIDISGTIANYGKALRFGTYSNLPSYLPGTIDEIRISNIARSTPWISTEYNNQNSPSSFLHIGFEEQGK